MPTMVAYCNDCKRFVNQYCLRCGGQTGIDLCRQFACGGRMACPFCNGSNLTSRKEEGLDPYEYRRRIREETLEIPDCPACNYKLKNEWAYCPMCGQQLKFIR